MFFLWPLKIAIKIVSLIVTGVLAYLVVSGVQVVLASRLPQGTSGLSHASTIVVLGSTVDNNAPSQNLQNRLQEGLACYQDHLAPSITVTGSSVPGQPNVASFEKGWFEQNGVPRTAINMVVGNNTAAQLQGVGQTIGTTPTAIIVTDALNAFWTSKVAAHDGIKAQIAPATNSEQAAYKHLGTIFRQASAIAVGRIFGFNRIFWA